ncbi:MAG TPA: polysaccharide deacetylase family protein [Candidatus Sulfotelmatobacter sp.]|nr:polysaccharide deacetylase family protein [Candidatus Sulfotelmatobacter sp.]
MRFVSPLLKSVVYPGLAGVGCFRLMSRPGIAVITYHGVLPPGYKPIDSGFDGSLITAQTFRQHLRILQKNYQIITPEHFLLWSQGKQELPPRAALLTCDDGFMNNLTEMVPILQEEELKCLFFVTGDSTTDDRTMLWHEELLLLFLRAPSQAFRITADGIELQGSLGPEEQRRVLWWDAVKRLSQVDRGRRDSFLQTAHSYFGLERSLDYYLENYPEARRHFCLMTRAELRQLADSGMTIGAHTLTHSILSQMPPELAWTEMVESRTRLEAVTGQRVWAFAYPFGDAYSVSPTIVSMAKQAGFEAAFLNLGGGLGTELPLHAIPRVHVNSGMKLAEFEAHVSGFYEALQRRTHRTPVSNLQATDISSSSAFRPSEQMTTPKTA